MAHESLNVPYLVLSGTLFLALIVSFILFKPQFTDWQAARAEATRLAEQVRQRQLFLTSIDQKSAVLRTNAAYDQELSVMLPADEAFDDMLRLLDRQAAAAGVRIINIDNVTANAQAANRVAQALGKGVDTPAALTVHGATIRLQGSYQQIRQFLSSLENAARFTDISTIEVTRAAEQGDLLEGSIATKFYSLTP
jgi:Tfp pilus assembly protein PilO